MRLYLEGATDSQIKAACGISRGQTYRLLTERCLKQHPDGNVYGWRGLLPHARVKSYQRTAPLELNAWSGGAVGCPPMVVRISGRASVSRCRSWHLADDRRVRPPPRPSCSLDALERRHHRPPRPVAGASLAHRFLTASQLPRPCGRFGEHAINVAGGRHIAALLGFERPFAALLPRVAIQVAVYTQSRAWVVALLDVASRSSSSSNMRRNCSTR